ncbi:histidine kinase, partial [Bacillus cereus]
QHVAPIIIWAAGLLGGWLATKLLDYGAEKFCKQYRNYNGVTKKVCEVIA